MECTLLFSDIHGKADRLNKLLEHYPETPAICLGDAVGIGDNDRTLQLLQERQVPCLLGNHEVDLIHLYEISPENRAWIKTWPLHLRQTDMLLCHTWIEGTRFHCVDSRYSAESMFKSSDFRVAFVGHSHSPGWWQVTADGDLKWTHASQTREVNWKQGLRYIVDVGSLGEPQRAADPSYCLWDEVGVQWMNLS